MSLVLRLATLNDIDSIMAIEKVSFSVGIRENRDVYLDRLRTFADGFYLLCDNSFSSNNSVIGYLCSEIWPSDVISNIYNVISQEKKGEADSLSTFFALSHSASSRHTTTGSVLYISSTGILPKYRGQKIGKRFFLGAVSRLCRNYPAVLTIVLVVNESWQAARKIYQRSGFTEIATIPSFFQTEFRKTKRILLQDAIVMTVNVSDFLGMDL